VTVAIINLQLPEPPSSNRYWRQARGRLYVSAEANAYKLVVMAAIRRSRKSWEGPVPFPHPTEVCITAHWTRAKRMGDLDNRLKVVIDALRGLAFTDDKQVTEIHAFRHDSPKNGGLELSIHAV
jgi:crossover junction endodeoxyribonuclease RusA